MAGTNRFFLPVRAMKLVTLFIFALPLSAVPCNTSFCWSLRKSFFHSQRIYLVAAKNRKLSSVGDDNAQMQKNLKSTSVPREDQRKKIFAEELNIIFDGRCSVCKWEVDFLTRRDAALAISGDDPERRIFRFTDLEPPDGSLYDPNEPANGGITYAEGMSAMHAVRSDGTVMSGVPVFRLAYELIGLGWLYSFTNMPVIGDVSDSIYRFFAKWRTNATRRERLDVLLREYDEKRRKQLMRASDDRGEGEGACIPCRIKTISKDAEVAEIGVES